MGKYQHPALILANKGQYLTYVHQQSPLFERNDLPQRLSLKHAVGLSAVDPKAKCTEGQLNYLSAPLRAFLSFSSTTCLSLASVKRASVRSVAVCLEILVHAGNSAVPPSISDRDA